MKTLKRSAAEQDISFYLNFDILSTILGLNCVLAFKSLAVNVVLQFWSCIYIIENFDVNYF